MELAHAMELARSLSKEILGKLQQEFRSDFFTGWQQISKKIFWSLYLEVV
jgi:hypothetical protein